MTRRKGRKSASKAAVNRPRERTTSATDNNLRGWKISRRQLLAATIASVAAIAGGTAVHAYDKRNRLMYDLGIIGGGTPVVVQIHDPGCPTCRRLKSRVTAALQDTPTIAYRLADITQPAGKAFQEHHDVPHVTLLWFDGAGKLAHQSTGLQTQREIQATARQLLHPPARHS